MAELVTALARDSESALNPGSKPSGVLVPGSYIGGSSSGLGKTPRIDSSLTADRVSGFWPDVNGGLPDRGALFH